MIADLPFQLERPIWLLLLLLIVPVAWMSRRSVGSVSAGKAWTATAFRAGVLLLLALALSQPAWIKRGRGLTVMMAIDVSQSIPPQLKREMEQYLVQVVGSRERPEDRVGVILVADQTELVALPDPYSSVSMPTTGMNLAATNLAEGIRRATSVLPRDTANRILLVSDGNETMDDVLAEAEVARAAGIPIDVLPIEYEHVDEVLVEALQSPARVRVGQSSDLRLLIRSQQDVAGTVRLFRNDVPVQLDPVTAGSGGGGEALAVELEAGANVLNIPVGFDEPGTHQFRAVFEPAVDAATGAPRDGILENNVGVAVTFVGGEGRVLVVHSSELESASLVSALKASGIDVLAVPPEAVTGGLAYLNGFDAVALVNVPRWALNIEGDDALHAYVHDLGGGLIMIGGPESFGAGGWIDSKVASALPVDMDPPQTRQMPRGALALIVHSCEMPQGNYWGEQVAIAAIEALSRLDYVGVVTFNFNMGGMNGASWTFPMQLAGDKSAAIAAVRQMVIGDMPDFGSSMQLAFDGLMGVNVGQRHSIIISDGDPQPPARPLLQQYIDNKITITTVMVAGHGTQNDLNNMQAVAGLTGGRFHNVTNPRNLPQIFVKEAQMVARSLIAEGDFQPVFASRLPGPITGFSSVPRIGGYVLAGPRGGLAQTTLINRTTEADDPIYASWNYGLGRSVAFTSDATSRWAAPWLTWPQFADFWEESFRWLMRPPTPSNVSMRTSIDGDRAIVELDAVDPDGGFLNFLRTSGAVIAPNGERRELVLQQIRPGRYRGEFVADDAGAYLVNVAFASGGSSGEGRSMEGTIQAAVAVPYSREFRAVRDNRALLRAVAERSGGRVMSMTDPRIVDYFDRGALDVPRSARHIWDLLAIIAAVVFLFDVAVRRIAIEPDAVASMVRRMTRPREAAAEQTVDAWKRARAQAGGKGGAQAGSRQGGAAVAKPAAEVDPSLASRKYEATEGGLSIDVGGESAEGARSSRLPGPASSTPGQAPPSKPADGDGGDYTSRLLRAKKRAADAQGDEGRQSGEKKDASDGGAGRG